MTELEEPLILPQPQNGTYEKPPILPQPPLSGYDQPSVMSWQVPPSLHSQPPPAYSDLPQATPAYLPSEAPLVYPVQGFDCTPSKHPLPQEQHHQHEPGDHQHEPGDHYFTLSIVMSFLCFLCGSWFSLFYTIPAIFYARNAKVAERNGNKSLMQKRHQEVIFLLISAIITYFITMIIVIAVCVMNQLLFI